MPTTPLGESIAFPVTAAAWAQGKGLLDVDGNIAVLKMANNLSDIPNKVNARFNLGLVIGTDVQAYSSKLALYAGGATPSAFSLGLLSSADAAAFRSSISAGSVTSVAALTLEVGGTDITSSVATGTSTPVITLTVPTASATARGALSASDWAMFNAKQAALLSGTNIKTIGSTSILGSGNIPVVTSVDISGGTTGLTFSGGPITGTGAFTVGGTLAIANGGTGATTASGARGLLGLGTIATQDSNNVTITGGTVSLSAGTASSPSWAFSASPGTGAYRGGADVFGISTAGVSRVVVDASGNVGIGTTGPNKALTVATPGTSSPAQGGLTGMAIINTDTTTSGISGISGYNTEPSGTARHSSAITFGKDGTWVNGTNFPGNIGFWTRPNSAADEVERVRIDSSGQMGIGTTAPAALFHVDGGAVISQRYGTSGSYISRRAEGNVSAPTSVAATAAVGIWVSRGYDGTAYRDVANISVITDGAITGTSSSGYLSFAVTASGSVSSLERMRLHSSGELRMVTPAVATEAIISLDPGGLGLGTRDNQIRGGNNGSNQTYIDFYTSNAAAPVRAVRIDNNGNLGIGATNPFAKLDVRGGIFISSTAAGSNPTNGGSLGISSGGLSVASNGATPITLVTNGTDRAYIQSTGNISIGTSNDKTRLNVSGSASAGVPSLGITSGSMFVSNNDNAYGILFGVNAADGGSWIQAQRTDGTATAYNLWLQPSGGNVGIGTASPGNKLHVVGSGELIKAEHSGSTWGGYGIRNNFGSASVNAGCYLNAYNESNIPFGGIEFFNFSDGSSYTNLSYTPAGSRASDRRLSGLKLDVQGNVGIGTTGPQARLHVNSSTVKTGIFSSTISATPVSTDAGEVFALTATATNGITFSGSDGRLATMGVNTDNSIYLRALALNLISTNNLTFSPGSAARGIFNSSGNMGIGTTSPDRRLVVKAATGGSIFLIEGDTSGGFQGMTLKNGGDSSAGDTISFYDHQNNLNIADSHMFFRHRTDGSSQFELGLTPAGSRSTDRRVSKFSVDSQGIYSGGDNTQTIGWSANRWSQVHAYQFVGYDTMFINGAGTSAWKRAIQFRDSASAMKWEIGNDLNNNGGRNWYVYDGIGGYAALYMDSASAFFALNILPSADNAKSLGTGSARFTTVYAVTGSINTSDRDAKDNIGDISETLLDAWGDVEWQTFQFKDSILEKGVDGARWHFGLIAQDVRDAIDLHLGEGEAVRLGLVCYDEWDETTEPVTETIDIPAVLDEDGTAVEPARQETEFTGETRVTREAGSRWGLRYDECFALEAAWQRRELAREKAARLALEARLTAAGF